MSRSPLLALGLTLALSSALLSSVAHAQHALPVEALAFDGLIVRSIRAPDTAELPVRVVLGTQEDARFRVDVWVAGSSEEAARMLAARLDTLSTLGLVPRSGSSLGRAFAPVASGPTGLVALAIENVVLVVRAIEADDAVDLSLHLAQAVRASAPAAPVSHPAPTTLDDVLTIQEPSGAVDWLVTCGGACEARRTDCAFRVYRTGGGDAEVVVHVVDAFLRAQHVRASR